MKKEEEKTKKIVMGAMMMCLIIVMTIVVKIPVPGTQGYVHLGDAMVFMTVMILGKKWGAVCSGVGSAMADIFLGGAMWAPWTLVIKGVMAYIVGAIIAGEDVSKTREIAAMTAGGIFMTAGYYAAEGIMYGNWAVALLGIPWNIGQFVVGGVLATVLAVALCKTKARDVFEYTLKG